MYYTELKLMNKMGEAWERDYPGQEKNFGSTYTLASTLISKLE